MTEQPADPTVEVVRPPSAQRCEELRRVINVALWYALWCEPLAELEDPCPLAEDAVRVLSTE
jgi:hypothetical protein